MIKKRAWIAQWRGLKYWKIVFMYDDKYLLQFSKQQVEEHQPERGQKNIGKLLKSVYTK